MPCVLLNIFLLPRYKGMVMEKKHLIISVAKDSIAEEMGIEPGDTLLSVNGQEIEDVFDYRFLIRDEEITVVIKKGDKYKNEEWELEIEKDEDEDLGIDFESGLMDEYRSCRNKCIFCFIDQMPKGMRETLYFKDDDSRLSFLQGNYITLTNMSDHNIERIIKYRLSPINISVHTTNTELRCKMLNNRFAGSSLEKLERLYKAGITMNGQIVLCKGVNDGDELRNTLNDLYRYAPYMQSVSVVPVGLTKYRDNLYPLSKFNHEDAVATLDIIEEVRNRAYKEHGIHFVTASDEFYILAKREFPTFSEYDDFPQIENGVGMIRAFLEESNETINDYRSKIENHEISFPSENVKVTAFSGLLAYPYIKEVYEKAFSLFDNLSIEVVPVRNDFFGEDITVTGLLTGQDIVRQLKEKEVGKYLLIPDCVLRSKELVLLDDMTVSDLEKALQVTAVIVKSNRLDIDEIIEREMI